MAEHLPGRQMVRRGERFAIGIARLGHRHHLRQVRQFRQDPAEPLSAATRAQHRHTHGFAFHSLFSLTVTVKGSTTGPQVVAYRPMCG